MKPLITLRPVWYFCVSLIVLMGIGLFVRDGLGLPGLFTQVDHLTDGLRVTDPATFAMAAKDVAAHGWLSPSNAWIFHLWPPGFVLLEAAVIKSFGDGILLIPVLQVASCALWAATLTLQRSFLRPLVGGVTASVAPLAIFAFPVARIFLVEPNGIIFGETFSVSTYICSVLLLTHSINTKKVKLACVAGVCLAVSAYFRSQYESLLLASTAMAIPLVAWQAIKSLRGGMVERYAAQLTVKAVLVALITAHLLMLPWRLHNWRDSGSFWWVQTMDVVIRNSLASEKTLLANGGDFVIEGGGNLACRLEPSYCGKSDRSLFWKAFVQHMPDWYRIKASLSHRYWNASVKDASKVEHEATGMDYFVNSVLLGCISLIVPFLIATRKYPCWPILIWSNASLFGGLFTIYSLVQFEVRYFYLMKLYGFVMMLMLGAMVWNQTKLRRPGQACPVLPDQCGAKANEMPEDAPISSHAK